MHRNPIMITRILAVPLLGMASLSAAPWSLEHPPVVPPPAPYSSKEPSDPASYQEVKMDFPITRGPFEPTWDSIRKNYPGVPDWFRNAKFGVFVHWGPQASGRSGDWYARHLYEQGSKAYNNHLRNFGHPAEFGYKDVLNAWKAPEWNPDELTKSFAEAGMRFMMVVGVHHDNFDLWDSKCQPWNSVNVGPRKDMIGGWAEAARKYGMRFCITFHHEYSWWWWAGAYRSDKSGPKAGIPYDGNLTLSDGKGKWWEGLDPRLLYNIDLGEYKDVANIPFKRKGIFQDHQEYAKWYAERWARRIQDAVEKYRPDMFYTDGNSTEPFSGDHSGSGFKSDAARRVVADFYNRSLATNGKVDALALIKFQGGNPAIGITSEITVPKSIKNDQPWIGENPIGDWYYVPGCCYETVNLVRSLLEFASRDGNYACAVPLTPEGGLDPACKVMLREMGEWMRINGSGIYGSRAWKTWGEGGGPDGKQPILIQQGSLSRKTAALPFSTTDFRFTVGKEGDIYAWCMAVPKPGEILRIRSLGTGAGLLEGNVKAVTVLGGGEIPFRIKSEALELTCPSVIPSKYAVGFRIRR